MKFTQYLLKHLVPEWIKFYLNFAYLKTHLSVSSHVKKLLRKAKKKLNRQCYNQIKLEIAENPQLMNKLESDNQQFITIFEGELDKITSFSEWKYREINDQFTQLKRQIGIMKQLKHKVESLPITITWNMKPKIIKHKQNNMDEREFQQKQETLLITCYRFYIECQQLQQYTDLNSEGIRKILKKYKKQQLNGVRRKSQENLYFGDVQQIQKQLKKLSQKIKNLKQDTENQMIYGFYEDDPSHCRHNLRKYTDYQNFHQNAIFYFGLFAGFAIVLILIIFGMRFDGLLDPNSDKVFNKVFPCFRGMALFLAYYWFISIDLAGWTYFNINYKLYFSFNYHFTTVGEALQRVSILTAIYLILFVWYCIVVEDSLGELSIALRIIDPRYIPLISWTILVLYIFVPTRKYFNPQGRKWMYKMIAGALWGHYIKYESRYTFFTDQFASMVTPMRDLDYTVCYYNRLIFRGIEHNGECDFRKRFTAALASILPFFFKCLQYITRARDKGKYWWTDEMFNFIKNMTALSVGVLAYLTRLNPGFKYVWIFVAAFCSCFEYWWDLKKDWLFFESDSKYRFLRNDLGYNNPSIYYTLAIVNFFLRLTWVLTISPDMYRILGVHNELFIMLFGFIEMSRRLVSNFLKIEKEHILNLRNLKTVQEIKFPFQDDIEMSVQTPRDVSSVSSLERESIVKLDSFMAVRMDSYPDKPQIKQLSPNISSVYKSQQKKVSFENLQYPLIDDHSRKLIKVPSNDQMIPRNISFDDFRKLKIQHQGSFRLTQIFEQAREVEDRNSVHQINVQTLEKVKLQEKLELKKKKELQHANKKYKYIIEQLYNKYNI